jgi:hypothetical protein
MFENVLISFSSTFETPYLGNKQMKKIGFVLAALAAIAFALPVTTADAKEMMHEHHHHHHHYHHHHHMKK